MILKNIKKGNIQDLSVDHLRFKVVSDAISVNLINLHSIDGIIIKSSEIRTVRQILNQIRTKNDPTVYLMPIYLDSRTLFKKLGNEVDGYIMENINPLNSSSDELVRQRISSITNDVSQITDYNDRMIVKALQHAYTRDHDLIAYADRSSSIGYHLPFISSVISDKEIIHAISRLDKLVGKTILTSQLADKVNLCNSCQGSYLNFSESCSKCSSLDLDYENLVHHFRCAYIGPESDFKNGDVLVCPKCDKQLKHIGIDYDKPAEVATCNSCTHTSQETKMKASCIDCGTANSLAQLKPQIINNYSLTMEGIDWIMSNSLEVNSEESQLNDLRIVPLAIFNLLIAQEKARAANRKNSPSFAGEIKIDSSLFSDLAEDFRVQLKQEVLKVLQSYLRPIDILCAHNTGLYSFMLPDCSQNTSYELYLILLDNLNKLLSDNISHGVPMVTGDLRKL